MKPVLLSLGGSGLADAAILEGTLRLLARGALGPARVLSASPRTCARFAHEIPVLPDSSCAQAVQESARLVVAGPLRTPAAMVRAANHVVQAKLAGVPSTLAAVRLAAVPTHRSSHAALRLLAQADSVSAGDCASARALERWRGARVECTAPVELLVDVEIPRAPGAFTIAVEARALANAGPALAEALQLVGLAWRARIRVVSSSVAAKGSRASNPWHGITSSALFVGGANATLLHVAAAHGAVPVALVATGARSDVHERLGLEHLTQVREATRDDWVCTLEQARCVDGEALRRRMTTLRVVAWRTLGILAEATRCVPLPMDELDTDCRAFVASVARSSPPGATLEALVSPDGSRPPAVVPVAMAPTTRL